MPVLHMSKGPQVDLARCKWDKCFPASIRTAKKTVKDFEKVYQPIEQNNN